MIGDYHKFVAYQNVAFALIGEPDSVRRKNIKKQIINENKKTIDAYNNLLRILNIENKYFEQDYFNSFLEDQNFKVKEEKEFDINKCKEIIKKPANPKIKQNFEGLVNEIDGFNTPIIQKKLN